MPNPVPATKKDIPTLTIARTDTLRQIPGAVQLRLFPRPVLAVLLPEPVTKLPLIPTVTPALPVTVLTAQTDILLPSLKSAPAVKCLEPVTCARASPKSVAPARILATTALLYLIVVLEDVFVYAEAITAEGCIPGIIAAIYKRDFLTV